MTPRVFSPTAEAPLRRPAQAAPARPATWPSSRSAGSCLRADWVPPGPRECSTHPTPTSSPAHGRCSTRARTRWVLCAPCDTRLSHSGTSAWGCRGLRSSALVAALGSVHMRRQGRAGLLSLHGKCVLPPLDAASTHRRGWGRCMSGDGSLTGGTLRLGPQGLGKDTWAAGRPWSKEGTLVMVSHVPPAPAHPHGYGAKAATRCPQDWSQSTARWQQVVCSPHQAEPHLSLRPTVGFSTGRASRVTRVPL